MASKRKTVRVSVELDTDLARGVSEEMAWLKKSAPGRATRAGAVRSVLQRQFRGMASSKRSREDLFQEILAEAVPLRDEGSALLSKGYTKAARRLLLEAASRELEALRVLDDPSEETLRSTLIAVVALLKDATGYRHLPDVPRPKRTSVEPTV